MCLEERDVVFRQHRRGNYAKSAFWQALVSSTASLDVNQANNHCRVRYPTARDDGSENECRRLRAAAPYDGANCESANW